MNMFEELGELLWGPWGIAVALIVGAGATEDGRKAARKAAKGAIKAGYIVVSKSQDLLAEAKERVADIVAEAKNGNEEAPTTTKRGKKSSS
jgi:Ni2+-binding GTPase involved in maturation of urease and hydrogenase